MNKSQHFINEESEFDIEGFKKILANKKGINNTLTKIENNKNNVKDKIYLKVKREYEEKLENVIKELIQQRKALKNEIEHIIKEKDKINLLLEEKNDLLQELEFRKIIDEIPEPDFEYQKQPIISEIEKNKLLYETLSEKVKELEVLHQEAFGDISPELLKEEGVTKTIKVEDERKDISKKEVEKVVFEDKFYQEEIEEEESFPPQEGVKAEIILEADHEAKESFIEEEKPLSQDVDIFLDEFVSNDEDIIDEGLITQEGVGNHFISPEIQKDDEQRESVIIESEDEFIESKPKVGSKVATLFIQKGPDAGKKFVLGEKTIWMGRNIKNDIQVNDPEVSRKHAQIFFENGNYILADNKSVNGCYVNGEKTERAILKHNDEIILGSTTLIFSLEDE